jgi:dTDP-4-amino-4,6-dideoxygalactose transaminase
MYEAGLRVWAAAHDVQLPCIPAECDQAYHMFYLLLPNLEIRQRFIQYLRDHGIHTVFHYLPLHLSDMGQKFGGQPGDCPVTERVSDQLVRLPFHNAMSSTDQEIVLDAILEFPF